MIKLPVSKSIKAPGPEHNVWYWNPGRIGVRAAPSWFMARLRAEMGEELAVTWNPINERWQVWAESPRFQHPICHGWRLLFVHNGPDGEHLPLDERVLARLYSASAQVYGNGKQYFEHMVAQAQREKEARERRRRADLIDAAMPSFDHQQIQVSGFGKSSGSKFATYHS